MRILITVPSFELTGGVANHYMGLASYFKNDVKYCFYGRRPHIPAVFCLLPDLVHYIWLLFTKHADVVVLNPSMRKYQLIRDGVYLLLAHACGKKVVTFFHGWDYTLSAKLQKESRLFKYVYDKSLFIYVLCSGFKKELEKIGMKTPILLSTTKVADNLLHDFYINKKMNNPVQCILFLARAERSKGLHIVLQSYAKVIKQYPYLKLAVCGVGGYLKEAQEFAKANKLNNVTFFGNVSGKDKIKCFTDADLYILPTVEEGMATSILEAMAFGLPIITRPVGGTKDFFDTTRMGMLIDSFDVDDYVRAIIYFIENQSKVIDIARYNHQYAIEHFMASKVAYKIESDIQNRLK